VAENARPASLRDNIDAIKELVLSQDAPAPKIHRIVRHVEHKNDISANLIFRK